MTAPLPGVLADIAEAAGLDAALKLARARGGTRVYLSPRARENGWLAEIVGGNAARAIVKRLGAGKLGTQIMLPLGPTGSRARRWQQMNVMIAAGASAATVARAYGIDERTVRRYRSRLKRPKERAPDLFSPRG